MGNKKDIVYVLKNDIDPAELRYSLRSVCENFDFNKIWFFGGCPDGFCPDYYVPILQKGNTKGERVWYTYEFVFTENSLTPNFYLFNDDFFILKPYDQDMPLISRSLDAHIKFLEEKYGSSSAYCDLLKRTRKALTKRNKTTLDYTTHTPLLINKDKGYDLLSGLNKTLSFRLLYGNIYNLGGAVTKDVKILGLNKLPKPDATLVSTSDKSFKKGKVGEYIRKRFPNPCRYELQPEEEQYNSVNEITEGWNS